MATSEWPTGLPFVVVPTQNDAEEFAVNFSFFNPKVKTLILKPRDISPYSGLLPQDSYEYMRAEALAHLALHPSTLIVACVESACELGLSFETFSSRVFQLKKNDVLGDAFWTQLDELGYSKASPVDRPGCLQVKGGFLDIFSPSEPFPARVELFGDEIESMKLFDPETLRTFGEPIGRYSLSPCLSLIYNSSHREILISHLLQLIEKDPGGQKPELDYFLSCLQRGAQFPGLNFLIGALPANQRSTAFDFCKARPIVTMNRHLFQSEYKSIQKRINEEKQRSQVAHLAFHFPFEAQFGDPERLFESQPPAVSLQSVDFQLDDKSWDYGALALTEVRNQFRQIRVGSKDWLKAFAKTLLSPSFKESSIQIVCSSETLSSRVSSSLKALQEDFPETQSIGISVVAGKITESYRFRNEKLILLKAQDLFGKTSESAKIKVQSDSERFQKEAEKLSFGQLRRGDLVVHRDHGVGRFEGMQILNLTGVDNEFLQLTYRDNEKLFLPVYRLSLLKRHSTSLAKTSFTLDKLGTASWYKTKVKLKSHLRDLTSDLIELYAKRKSVHRNPIPYNREQYLDFCHRFPFEETPDQEKAISDILGDLESDQPMDRLVCGDVGFGKTEVAMRAAFLFFSAKKQVAVLAPTTVLTFQHFESFKKRFSGFDVKIEVINRFVSASQQREILKRLTAGDVDILIGTHRLLSKDIQFSNLGLLVVDEEQKFGVTHKEKIKKMKVSVDNLAMSATPIPRTLNFSMLGIRDLSLIHTAPVDRLPIQTFISEWDQEVLKTAIDSEIKRGGQVYFVHNRVQTIGTIYDKLKQLFPNLRIRIGHGQMAEHELESTMLDFYRGDIDILLCTTIIESGVDLARANTMIIDKAHQFGLSQLYQLRGRVGRSPTKAYCYLLIPPRNLIDPEALDRLKVLQNNSSLGSGIHIAQYDLEIRGAGDLLGESQSGFLQTVGYETYMDLLQKTISEVQSGSTSPEEAETDPEIQIKIPAYIPDQYIQDIRSRLYYYKALNEVSSESDLSQIEAELEDIYGKLPETVVNLFGLMLIKAQCRTLKVSDLTSGPKGIVLRFQPNTPLSPEKIMGLVMRQPSKYTMTPDSKLKIMMSEPNSWNEVFKELNQLV